MHAIPFGQRDQTRARLRSELAATRWGIIRKGMQVWGRDGKVGRVMLIVRDRYTQEPAHLVVRRGWLWGRRVLIPLHWTIAILDDRIDLNIRLWQLEHLPEYRSDEQIAQAALAAFAASPTFMTHGDFAAVRVQVRDGVVSLRGNVRDGLRRFEAQAIANRVLGVQEVRNELIADDELQLRVEQAITSDATLRTLNASATVNLGVVHLRGYVPTAALYERLLAAVRQVDDVRAIWDDLAVIPPLEQQAHGTSALRERQGLARPTSPVETVGS